jgi:hypothetical protein
VSVEIAVRSRSCATSSSTCRSTLKGTSAALRRDYQEWHGDNWRATVAMNMLWLHERSGMRMLHMRNNTVWRPALLRGLACLFLLSPIITTAAEDTMILIDDRQTGDLLSNLGTQWRLITDGVMGGVSSGTLGLDQREGRDCLRLQGEVSLQNNGGFIQAALELAPSGVLDASAYSGVELDVYGNGEAYNVHLKTSRVWLPWQHYRASFMAEPGWHSVRVPFAVFEGYRIGTAFDPARLERIGIVAYGRAFTADLCIGRVALYRDA